MSRVRIVMLAESFNIPKVKSRLIRKRTLLSASHCYALCTFLVGQDSSLGDYMDYLMMTVSKSRDSARSKRLNSPSRLGNTLP